MIHMRIFRITATRPEIFVRWTRNERDAHAVRRWLAEADPHASIEVVQFELSEEGVLALLNTIGSSAAGGPGGDVDPRWRPIIRRAHYTAAEVTLTPSIAQLDALVAKLNAERRAAHGGSEEAADDDQPPRPSEAPAGGGSTSEPNA